MSKKLIAVAAAAALALTGLIVMPTAATATGPFNVVASGNETTNQVVRNGASSGNALQIFVPSNDVIRSSAYASNTDDLPEASSTAIRLVVTTPGATDAITITATGGVKVLTNAQFTETSPAPSTSLGVQSLTVAAAAGAATVFAYTTSTAAGTVVLSAAGSSKTIYVQGLSPVGHNQYKLAFTAPATGAIGGTVTVTGTVRDMFDNLLTPAAANLTVTALGGNLANTGVVTDFKVDATTKVVTFKVGTASTATQQAFSVSAVNPADAVTAFPGRAVSVFTLVNTLDLAAQVATLTAQVAALQATVAASRTKALSVTKKKYNSLARKWNASNPSARVALKK